jgi:anti-sigma regulatory factor (Ser/Thr protein kinase)
VLSLPRAVRFEWVTSLTTDPSGSLWLCTVDEGVLRLAGGVLTPFSEAPDVSGRACNVAFTDSSGRVWLGFARGGIAVHENGRFTTYGEKDGLASGNVMAIYEDSAGAVWISTSSGLSRFSGHRFTSLDAENGLPGGIVPSIIEDGEGFMWLGVNSGSGLVRFSRAEIDKVAADRAHRIQYMMYDVSDGLQGVLHWRSHPSAVRSGDGNLWFVTGTGVAVVDPHRLPPQRPQSPPRIERVVVDGHAYSAPGRLALPRGTSNLQIEYTALELSAASKLRFRYMLEGLSPDWVDAGARREAAYSNIPPGEYRFRVSATTGGVWSEMQTVWEFSVPPPVYQTATFYLASALLVALIVWAYWSARMRTVRNRFALVLHERARVSREIHDTLLQDLGAIRLELEVVASQLDSSNRSAGESLRSLHTQVGRCIREARHSIWELRSPRLDARDLVTGLQGLADDVKKTKDVHVEVLVHGTLRQCPQEVEEQLLRIGQEALNNAVRHGQASRIDIAVDYRRDVLSVRIADDGLGFASASEPDPAAGHWGLVNMKERAASIGARFAIASDVGRGTSVEIIVPLGSAAPAAAGHYATIE